MNKYFILEPEVAGQLGNRTIIDTSTIPPTVHKLHYEFDGWLGDDILESYPCFICSERLMIVLKNNNLSGYVIDCCEISKSATFNEIYPLRELPFFYWFKVIGSNGDDFSLNEKSALIVSERALSILKQLNINHCDIQDL